MKLNIFSIILIFCFISQEVNSQAVRIKTDTTEKAAIRFDDQKTGLNGTIDTFLIIYPTSASQSPGSISGDFQPWIFNDISDLQFNDDVYLKTPIFSADSVYANDLFLEFDDAIGLPQNATINDIELLISSQDNQDPYHPAALVHFGRITLNNDFAPSIIYVIPFFQDTLETNYSDFGLIVTISEVSASDIFNGHLQIALTLGHAHNYSQTSQQLLIDVLGLKVHYSIPVEGEVPVHWSAGVDNGNYHISRSTDISNNQFLSIKEDGTTRMKKLQVTDGAGYGKILASHTDGKATWRYPSELGINSNIESDLQFLDVLNDTIFLLQFPEPGDSPGNVGGYIPIEDINYWSKWNDTMMYQNGPVLIDNSNLLALGFDNGKTLIQNSMDVLKSKRSTMNFLIDSDNNSPTDQFTIYHNTNSGSGSPVVRFHLDKGNSFLNSGNFGLRTNSPNADLHLVHGTANEADGFKIEHQGVNEWFRFFTEPSGQLFLFSDDSPAAPIGSFDPISGVYTSLSDAKLKKNIKPLYPVLDKLLELGVKSYNFKHDPISNQRNIGFLAQEVMQYFPEVVHFHPLTKTYTMDYSAFGVIAIQAIKEQELKIQSLENRLNNLEKIISKKH